MNVGDYVRTKSGFIDKITNINDFREQNMKYALEQPSWNDDIVFIGEKDIIKSSPNIIDLIEVGDYVNGKKVAHNCIENGGNIVLFTDMDCANENNIKSIVTHEQFSQMEYKVGE